MTSGETAGAIKGINHNIGEPNIESQSEVVTENNPEEWSDNNESGIPRCLEECPQTRHDKVKTKNIPAALKQLPHNAAGQKEHMVVPEDGWRRLRRNKHI